MQMHSYYRFIILLLLSAGITHAAEKGDTISLAVGETKQIELRANPSTGYSWVPTTKIEENPYIVLMKSDFKKVNRNGMAGSSSVQYWKIKGKQKGSTTLTLEYKRPWEKNVKPSDIKTFVINIE